MPRVVIELPDTLCGHGVVLREAWR